MKQERGVVLITVVFLLVILLVIGLGLASVGTGGVENSISVASDTHDSQKYESALDVIKNGTKWDIGTDTWVDSTQDPGFAAQLIDKNKMIVKIFVNNNRDSSGSNSKTFNFTLPPLMTTPGPIYVTLIQNDTAANYSITGFTGPSSILLDKTKNLSTTSAICYKTNSDAASGDYAITLTKGTAISPLSDEYVLFIRVFCNN